jgi:hypothetical protein
MTTELPTEEELHRRITLHLASRPGNTNVILLWLGYIAALSEWGRISVQTHERLYKLLPNIGTEELGEIFLGTKEQQAEYRAFFEEQDRKAREERDNRLR